MRTNQLDTSITVICACCARMCWSKSKLTFALFAPLVRTERPEPGPSLRHVWRRETQADKPHAYTPMGHRAVQHGLGAVKLGARSTTIKVSSACCFCKLHRCGKEALAETGSMRAPECTTSSYCSPASPIPPAGKSTGMASSLAKASRAAQGPHLVKIFSVGN